VQKIAVRPVKVAATDYAGQECPLTQTELARAAKNPGRNRRRTFEFTSKPT
jgi:hypothetical protein